MTKLLTLILLAVVAYLAIRRWNARPEAPPKKEAAPEPVVACDLCGLHVPLSESVASGDRRYCCEDHLRRGAADRKS